MSQTNHKHDKCHRKVRNTLGGGGFKGSSPSRDDGHRYNTHMMAIIT